MPVPMIAPGYVCLQIRELKFEQIVQVFAAELLPFQAMAKNRERVCWSKFALP
jgi:hypothetical protein